MGGPPTNTDAVLRIRDICPHTFERSERKLVERFCGPVRLRDQRFSVDVETKISELSAEIRKLKAMIVKHESRIRTLETKNRELEQACIHNNNGQGIGGGSGGGGGSGHSAGEDLDPDEV